MERSVYSRDYKYSRKTGVSEVKDVLKKIKVRGTIGPIPIEIWRSLGDSIT